MKDTVRFWAYRCSSLLGSLLRILQLQHSPLRVEYARAERVIEDALADDLLGSLTHERGPAGDAAQEDCP